MKNQSKRTNHYVLNQLIMIVYQLVMISCQPHTAKVQVAESANFKFEEQTIEQIQQGYKDGSFTIKELTQAYLDRIDSIDKNGSQLGAMIQINPDVIQIAEGIDRVMKAGKISGLMHGIPVVLEDNIYTHDKMATTTGSCTLSNSYPLKALKI